MHLPDISDDSRFNDRILLLLNLSYDMTF